MGEQSLQAIDEAKKCADKILKLANQFDKELIDRDKAQKKAQNIMWDDIQSLFTQHQNDVTDITRQVSDLQAKKCEKQDITQHVSKLQSQLNSMQKEDFSTRLVNLNSDVVSRIADLRADFSKRVTE